MVNGNHIFYIDKINAHSQNLASSNAKADNSNKSN